MRILDADNDLTLNNVTLYLKSEEARQMLGYLKNLLDDPQNNHAHVNDDEYQHEVTLVIYTESNIQSLNARSQRVILEDR